jgi:4a-hydroxytetrahydrobiopterin dehydratase
MPKLTSGEISDHLGNLSGWQQTGNAIQKQFKFDDFKLAMAFANRIADAAEAADHHPVITIDYSRVILSLSTHSAGGITEKDFALARQIESAYQQSS